MIFLITLCSIGLFGSVSWLIWKSFRRANTTGARIGLGICLGITGLLALISSVCGVMIINA